MGVKGVTPDTGGAADFFARFNSRAYSDRVPLAGSLDLTYRCNLRCRHCYIPEEFRRRGSPEMGRQRALRLVDEVAEAGSLFFLISGGEPLLHRDFPSIYRRARERGLLVSVFSNGTAVTAEHLGLFAELPPRAVEITLYGASAATYEKITGVPGSFGRCRAGIDALMAKGVPVRLKTMLMTLNRDEFREMESLADRLGVPFRLDPALFPRLDGDRAPLELRVDAGDAVALELSRHERRQMWRDHHERTREWSYPDSLYQCGAGRTVFHVDPAGILKPCIMTAALRYDLAEGTFSEGWRKVMSLIGEAKAPDGDCAACDKKQFCGYCPSFCALESGSETSRSDYLCDLGKERHRIVTGACR
jgi:MoaA/NifB/PqqE/SkfB family radical SAM enzyme